MIETVDSKCHAALHTRHGSLLVNGMYSSNLDILPNFMRDAVAPTNCLSYGARLHACGRMCLSDRLVLKSSWFEALTSSANRTEGRLPPSYAARCTDKTHVAPLP
jgi:hypothetical protein